MKVKPTGLTTRRRLTFLMVFVVGFFVILAGRLAYWMLYRGEELQERALAQWTRSLRVTPKRGTITDANGKPLAISASAVTIVVRPEEIIKADETFRKTAEYEKDPSLEVPSVRLARSLAEILGVDEQETLAKILDKSRAEQVVMRQIDRTTVEPMRSWNYSGLRLVEDSARYYPMGDYLTQVLGFCDVSGQGQTGLEKSLDKFLAGTPGRIINEADRKNIELPYSEDIYVEPIDGYDITLTIDQVIQGVAERAMRMALEANNAKAARCIVMDVKTGALLAVVNKPDFDLNEPPRSDIDLLNALSRNGLVTDNYEPGSTLKIFTTAAALDSGTVTTDWTYYDTGSIMVDGDKVRCWRTGNPHGHQTLKETVMNSCNPAFVQLGLMMGRDTLYSYLSAFGFGDSTSSGLPGEASGIMTSIKYVRNVDLARIAFGQSIAVTPLQLITAGCAAVNDGKLMKPYIVDSMRDKDGRVVQQNQPIQTGQAISAETSAQIREILEAVVRDGGGRNAYIPGYRVGGKTGTAQKYENGKIRSDVHIGSFLGFAPMDNPRIAVLVIVDESDVRPDYGSVTAAPYARQILEEALRHLAVVPEYTEGEKNLVGKTRVVPDVRGKTLAEAQKAMSDAGLTIQLENMGAIIIDQLPPAGTQVPEKSMVMLYLDQETAAIEEDDIVIVPDVTGKSIMEANRMLISYGFSMRIKGTGLATGQSPAAGSTAHRFDQVTVTFSEP